MNWAQWREEFPSAARLVHMNHAGISPLPRRVAAAIRSFADQGLLLDRDVYQRWEARAEVVRTAAARLIGARAHEIAFIRSTSEGLSLVASGLTWQAGDNVVSVADEYPSNVYPWFGLRRFGVETRLLARPALRFGPDDIVKLIDARTRVVAVSAVDWQSGFRTDLAALAELCRVHDVLLVVDGIQAVGALQIDVGASGVDVLAAGGHKWLLAPEGCGMLFVSDRIVERIQPVVLGWKSVQNAGMYLPYHFDLRADAARFEPGSAPHLGIHAFGAALDLLLEIGPAAIEARVLEITDRLAEDLARLGAAVLSPRAAAERSAILTFALGDSPALHAALTDAGITVRQRLGGIRLAPHFYNDADDIARVLDAVRAFRDGTPVGAPRFA
jgi:selenocysteine lyase/cysteine desulfurase